MKAKYLLKTINTFMVFVSVFFWTTFSVNAQCPTITNSNPGPICDASGYTFTNLSNDYATDNGNGIVWYKNPSGGNPITPSQMVIEGVYYIDDASGSCGTRESITVTFQVNNSGDNLDHIYCSNENVLIKTYLEDVVRANIPSGGSVKIFYDYILTNEAGLDDVIPPGALNLYVVFLDSSGCKSQLESGQVGVFVAPENPSPDSTQIFCAENNPTIGDLNIGSSLTNYSWHEDIDVSGVPILPELDSSTPLINGKIYYIETKNLFCASDPMPVTVVINNLVDTGISTNLEFCNFDLPTTDFNLFDELGGTPETTGAWSGPLSVSSDYLGTVNVSSLTTPGTYVFTYSSVGNDICSKTSSEVIIAITQSPESGTVNTPIEFCVSEITSGQEYDLFELLSGEDQTGIWSDDSGSGALVGNMVSLDGLSQGTYDFTFNVDAMGNCDDIDVTVRLILNDVPPPAIPMPQEFCDTATVGDLKTNTTGVLWYDVVKGGVPLAETTTLVHDKIYFAVQTDTSIGCESSMRTPIKVIINESPNIGNINGTPLVVCNTDNNIDLFLGLDGTEDTGGTWQDIDNTGGLIANVFDATTVSPGVYQFKYTVSALSPCIENNITISVTVEPPLSSGTDNILNVCTSDGVTDLFTLLGAADQGGIWSPSLTSGTGVFDPLVDSEGAYTYTVTNACGALSSTIDVSVSVAPNSGVDNSITMCVVNNSIDLFTLLGTDAQSGGTWSPSLTSGTGLFDPMVDQGGVYTYTVTATSPCSLDSSSKISVTVNDTPVLRVGNSNPLFCLIDKPTVSSLSTTINSTGTVNWYEDSGLTVLLDGTEALVNGEDYYATQTNSTGCESSIAIQVNVTVTNVLVPTLIDSNAEYCINDKPSIQDLTLNITEYNSNTNNVVWYDAEVNGNRINSTDLLVDSTTYYAVLINPITGCEGTSRLPVVTALTSCGVLKLPDGFSPNGDGINDTYEIDNLAFLHPNFEIEIYNRNGNLVYKGNASTPRFDGTSNQSGVVLKGDLPVGVYFYVFKFNDGKNNPEQGRLYLSR